MPPEQKATRVEYEVLPIHASHIPQVVDVHMRAFPDFFLTFLGPQFLKQFYASFASDPMGVGFVAWEPDSGRVLGVVVGPVNPAGYFKRLLKRRWWAFCLASCRAVLRRPTVVKRLARAVFYRGEAPEGTNRSLLSSIAVAPEAQGMGLGRALVNAWLGEVRRRGSTGAFLTTDAHNNESTNRFYQKSGWRLEKTYTTPEGRAMNRYVMDFASEGS